MNWEVEWLERWKQFPFKEKWSELRTNYEFRACFPCITSPLHFFLLDRLPILRWVRSYSFSFAVRDLIAGLTVGLMVIPQALAYARLAGLPLQYGLYSSFMGCFIYFLFGSSKDITLGPTAIMSTLVAHNATKGRDPYKFACYAVSLSLISGLVQFGLGVFNLGFVVEFISFPVINGFTSAAAITIAVGQVHSLLGIDLSATNYTIGHSFLDNVYGDFRYITYFTPSDIICGLVCMVILFSLKQMKNSMDKWRTVSFTSPVEYALRQTLWIVTTARNAVVVIGAGLLAYSMSLVGLDYLTLVKELQPGLPGFQLPLLDATVADELGLGIILVPLIGILESIAIAKAFARKNSYRINANQEILTLGLANLFGAFFQAFPITGSFSRTAVNSQSGVATPAGGVYTGVLVILALSFLTPAFRYIPSSSLAAIIITAVLPMVDWRVPLELVRVYPIDALWWLVSFLGTLFVGLEQGVLIACAASLLPVLYRMLRPSLSIRSEPPETIHVTIHSGLSFPVNRHPPIPLPHGVPVQLGRSRDTLVTDKRCSRVQLELIADYGKEEVSIEHKGTLPSSVAGEVLADGKKVTIGNGSFFCLTADLFKYHVFFQANTSENTADRNVLDSVCATNSSESEEMEEPTSKKSKIEDFFVKNPVSSTRSTPLSKRIIDGSLVLYKSPLLHSRIAAFDLDGTLITTKSGNVFPRNTSDWRALYPGVKSRLQELHHQDHYDILIFSNQMGVSRGKPLPDIASILSFFQVPANVLFATSKDIYRKPAPGMWHYFLDNIVEGAPLNLADSFYCGDAAGRPANPSTGKKKDFSDSDLKFSHNISLTFYTPEELFLGHEPPTLSFGSSFNPYEYRERLAKTDLLTPRDAALFRKSQELILLVGCQASGKSHFHRQHLAGKGYVHISQDLLKTREKCILTTERLLEDGKSVVVDNTNPDLVSRKGFVQICQKMNIPVRAFWMSASLEHCRHNNVFRRLTEKSKAHASVDERVMNVYQNKFEEPKCEEGFEEVVKVKFLPSFTSKEEENLYFKFLI